MKNFRAQCFFGKQRMKYNVEKTEYLNHGDKNEESLITLHNHEASLGLAEAEKKAPAPGSATNVQAKSAKKPAKKTSSKRKNLHLAHKPSDETDLLITTVNDGDFGFKVDSCKL